VSEHTRVRLGVGSMGIWEGERESGQVEGSMAMEHQQTRRCLEHSGKVPGMPWMPLDSYHSLQLR
jgi:hypothetical protein